MNTQDKLEPMLAEENNRYTLFPLNIKIFGVCIKKPYRWFGQLKR